MGATYDGGDLRAGGPHPRRAAASFPDQGCPGRRGGPTADGAGPDGLRRRPERHSARGRSARPVSGRRVADAGRPPVRSGAGACGGGAQRPRLAARPGACDGRATRCDRHPRAARGCRAPPRRPGSPGTSALSLGPSGPSLRIGSSRFTPPGAKPCAIRGLERNRAGSPGRSTAFPTAALVGPVGATSLASTPRRCSPPSASALWSTSGSPNYLSSCRPRPPRSRVRQRFISSRNLQVPGHRRPFRCSADGRFRDLPVARLGASAERRCRFGRIAAQAEAITNEDRSGTPSVQWRTPPTARLRLRLSSTASSAIRPRAPDAPPLRFRR